MSADLEGVETTEPVDPQTVRDLVMKVNQLEEDRDDLQDTVAEQQAQLDEQAEEIQELKNTTQEAKAKADAAVNQVKTTRDYIIGDRIWQDIDTEHDAHSRLETAMKDVKDLKDTVSRLDDIIDERGTPENGKEKHWWKVVEKAHNLKDHPDHGLPNNWVKLHKKQIAGAIEPGEKRASQLIDEWAEEKSDGVKKQPYKRITSGRKTESSNIQKKALKIDLDVWGLDNE